MLKLLQIIVDFCWNFWVFAVLESKKLNDKKFANLVNNVSNVNNARNLFIHRTDF